MKQSPPGGGPASPASPVAALPRQRRKGERRPEPVLSEAYAHLSVDGLREYRRALSDEEHRVSYWRRILQARLDLLTTSDDDRSAVERLRGVLGGDQAQTRRSALLTTLPLGDGAPLPDLPALWQTAATDDPAEIAALVRRLRDAESQLSAYRSALHLRLDLATRELIARYYADPLSCLVALPRNR